MVKKRRQFSAEFKAKVALEAVRGQKTASELSSEHGVHINQITQWKKQLLAALPEVFGRRRDQSADQRDELADRLYQWMPSRGLYYYPKTGRVVKVNSIPNRSRIRW